MFNNLFSKDSDKIKGSNIINKKYDKNNVFYKILTGDLSCNKVYEDEFCLAFKDINPKARIHILLIPKGLYIDAQEFHENANDHEITGFYRVISKICSELNIKSGYRLLSNCGKNAGQEVPHYHIHILSEELSEKI